MRFLGFAAVVCRHECLLPSNNARSIYGTRTGLEHQRLLLEFPTREPEQRLTTNDQGLGRYIGEAVKREVRKRCGFGCVICGNAIIHYDHLKTQYVEAVEHDPNDITLLCGSHHDQKTRRWLPLETVVKANASPACLKDGFVRGPLHFAGGAPEIVLGDVRCVSTRNVLTIDGDPIISISPPETAGEPYVLSARIVSSEGDVLLEIVNNEWSGPVSNWDIQAVGPRVQIRRGLGDILIEFSFEEPNRLIFERVHLSHRGITLDYKAGGACVFSGRFQTVLPLMKAVFTGAETAIAVDGGSLALGKGGSVYIDELRIGGPTALPQGGSTKPSASVGRLRKTGRNEQCPCGSMKKFKFCHGRLN
jgi:hypothetical protein